MAASEYLIRKLYNEDKSFVINSRIDKVLKINEKNVALIVYNQKESRTILLSLDPNLPICLLGKELVSFVEETNGFIANIKKYLEYGTIIDFQKVDNDRILKFIVKKRLPTYVYQITTLILELIPLRANMLLLDEGGIIIDAFHKSGGFNGQYPIMKGLKYRYKEVPNKTILPNDTLDEIKYKVSKKEYTYLSSLDAETFLKTKKELLNSSTYYMLPTDISLLPLPGAKGYKKEELINVLLNKYIAEGKKKTYQDIINFVTHKIKKIKTKLINLENDLISCEEYTKYKDYGTLLYLGSPTYHRGDNLVIIEGVSIPLLEDKDLSSNASYYFKKYKKGKSGIIQIQNQIEISKKELLYFEEIKTQLYYASKEDYQDIILQLERDHYLKAKKSNHKGKEKKIFTPHILNYLSVKIGYGLSSFQNDYLTFTLAHKEDIFLHVKDYHGPHVIIFEENPSNEVILFAAELSLFFAHKDEGDVYYAKREDIKKIPAKLGMVELNKYQEIHLRYIRDESLSILNKLK